MPQLSRVTTDAEQAMSIKYNTMVYELQRSGKNVIVMSLGEAFFDIPLFPMDEMPMPQSYHYSHSRGILELRRQLAAYYHDSYGVQVDAESEILVTAGSKAAIHMTLMSILDPGDEVLIHEPAWVSYPEQVKLCYGRPVSIPYDRTVFDFGQYVTPRTKAIIVNNPNNPRGYVFNEAELRHLLDLAEQHNLWVLCDETYSDFVTDGSFISIGRIDAAKRNAVIFNSISKNYGISGWRLGYVIGKPDLIFNVLKVNQHLITCPATILSYYIARHFNRILDITMPQIREVVEKRAKLARYMDEIGLQYLPGTATFYFFVSIAPSSLTSEEFCTRLLEEDLISTVPGLGYGESCDKFIRVSVGTASLEDNQHGFRCIKRLIDATRSGDGDAARKPQAQSAQHAKHRTILHLGAGPLLGESIRILRDRGFKIHAIDRDPEAPAFALADSSEPIDFSDVDAVAECARRINADLILGVNEIGVWTAAQASERLGLPNIPVDVAWRCLHKGEMRTAWQKADLRQPEFRILKSLDELPAAAEAIGYPVVLKPTFGWGSRGVSVIRKRADLARAVAFAREHARQPDFIVERLIVGTELTVEGLVQDGRPVVLAMSDKEHQQHDQYCVAMALDYPPDLPESRQRDVESLVQRAALALGLRNGAFHCECLINDDGVFLVELGARGGGGHIFGTIVEAASGVCMPNALVHILLGEKVDIRPKWHRAVSYRFFAPPQGVFLRAEDTEAARKMPGILQFGFNMAAGTLVKAISGDADRPGFVVSTAETRQECIAAAQRAIKAVRFIMSESDVGKPV